MSELLTKKEQQNICNQCRVHECRLSICWHHVQAQLAKDKAYYEKEIEWLTTQMQDIRNSTEKFVIPARIAEERAKLLAEIEGYGYKQDGVFRLAMGLDRWQSIKELKI